jgi:hypothetical protein
VFLATPPHMEHYDDGICAWIKLKEAAEGPAYVYKTNFDNKSDKEISDAINYYREKGMPDLCFLTPFSAPKYIRELLNSIGINIGGDSYGMALSLDKMNIAHWKERKLLMPVHKVNEKEQFFTWTKLVNDELFNALVINLEQYYYLW